MTVGFNPRLPGHPVSTIHFQGGIQRVRPTDRVQFTGRLTETERRFLDQLEQTLESTLNTFMREYYLFDTARLRPSFNPVKIMLQNPGTVVKALSLKSYTKRLGQMAKAHPEDERIKRLYVASLGYYAAFRMLLPMAKLENRESRLTIDVSDLHLTDDKGQQVTKILYRDSRKWLRKISDKAVRETLAQRGREVAANHLNADIRKQFDRSNRFHADFGHANQVDFYSWAQGHDLRHLGRVAQQILDGTQDLYGALMPAYYAQRTGADFSQATTADTAFVFDGPNPDMEAIDRRFGPENLLPLIRRTFDTLGLNFSAMAQEADFKSVEEYRKTVIENADPATPRVFLDVAERPGKTPRGGYMMPFRIPSEIFLVVTPRGGSQDYHVGLHEGGHAVHFLHMDPTLNYAMKMLGNKTGTETYAYLFEKQLHNPHFLQHQVGLSEAETRQYMRKSALWDLFMLRRYAGKVQFELKLLDRDGRQPTDFEAMGKLYANILTRNTGFRYQPEGFIHDVDGGFYSADYLSAWIMEAQLREYLEKHYGTPANRGQDWYLNPQAGEFLKALWRRGSISHHELSRELGYDDPTNIQPLLRSIQQKLSDSGA